MFIIIIIFIYTYIYIYKVLGQAIAPRPQSTLAEFCLAISSAGWWCCLSLSGGLALLCAGGFALHCALTGLVLASYHLCSDWSCAGQLPPLTSILLGCPTAIYTLAHPGFFISIQFHCLPLGIFLCH